MTVMKKAKNGCYILLKRNQVISLKYQYNKETTFYSDLISTKLSNSTKTCKQREVVN